MAALFHQIASEFNIPVSTLLGRHRTAHVETQDLALAEVGDHGKEHLPTPLAADASRRMQSAAASAGISIFIVSAFRSVERQAQIIRRELARRIPPDQVLAVSALPGYSEHHTGRAVDVGTPEAAWLEYSFQGIAAFSWLQARAADFGFRLSYPPDKQDGDRYEPWHWCYERGTTAAAPLHSGG